MDDGVDLFPKEEKIIKEKKLNRMSDGIHSQVLQHIEKHNEEDLSSSPDSDDIDRYATLHSVGKTHLFGRQKPLHLVFGGGKCADVIMWRKKNLSAGMLGAVTLIWILFEWIGYHLLTFLCHSLILSLAIIFLWSKLAPFINIGPPELPKVNVSEDLFVTILLSLRAETNRVLMIFRDVASGKKFKKFLLVIGALWILSIVGSWFSFLTLCYLVFVLLQTVPVLYEKHEDEVDKYGEQAWIEIQKQYVVLDQKVLQKLPMFAAPKDHKQH